MSKVIQFNLRIPQKLKDEIAKSSSKTGRSINAEAQFRLENSFTTNKGNYLEAINELKKFFKQNLQPNRLQEISEQLHFLLAQTNTVMRVYADEEITIPQIAYELGHNKVRTLEDYFLGHDEPTFEELKQLSKYFSATENWLCFKKGNPYLSKKTYTPTNDLVRDLQEMIGDQKRHQKFFIIRNKSNNGEILINRVFEKWYFETITTPIQLNNQSDALNDYQKSALSIMLKYLVHHFEVISYHVDKKDFDQISQGLVHPLTVLSNYPKSQWALDLSTLEKHTIHWEGWNEMCDQIANHKFHCDIKKFSEHVMSIIQNN